MLPMVTGSKTSKLQEPPQLGYREPTKPEIGPSVRGILLRCRQSRLPRASTAEAANFRLLHGLHPGWHHSFVTSAGPPPQASVLLSYSHDSDAHREAVLALADRLRREHGIAAWIDQYDEIPPPRSWPEWMYRKVSDARFVLVICTAPYRRRFEDREAPGRGRGARWEGAIITQELYEQQSGEAVKFIPVLLHGGDSDDIPDLLRGTTYYELDRDWDKLIRHLEDRPLAQPPALGAGVDAGALVEEDHRDVDGSEATDRPSVSEPGPGRLDSRSSSHGTPIAGIGSVPPGEDEPSVPTRHMVLSLPEGYESLRGWFASRSTSNQQLDQALEVMQAHPARTVLLEPRFFDRDYREEFATFYSRLFKAPPSNTTRLHFFADGRETVDAPTLRSDAYLGSVIIRPVESARLGPTRIAPPPALRPYVETSALSGAEVYGRDLQVRSAPYIQVDPQVGIGCVAAVSWMCHATAALRGIVPAAPLTAFLANTPGVRPALRNTYREGMTLEEMQAALARNGLTSAVHDVSDLPAVVGIDAVPVAVEPAARIRVMLLRYLGSGFPVIAIDGSHAVVVVGRMPRGEGGEEAWIIHDSDGGPYLRVPSEQVFAQSAEDLVENTGGLWRTFCTPLPESVALGASAAEGRAALLLRPAQPNDEETGGELRTRLVSGADYRRRLVERDLDPDAVERLHVALLPEWIWLVQLIEREGDGESVMVRAEVLLDAASSSLGPDIVAVLGTGELEILEGPEAITSAVTSKSWRPHPAVTI